MNYAVILAGGRGERFWPLSRRSKPKQLLRLFSDKCMLEETILRVQELVPTERIRIVTNRELKDQINKEITYLTETNFIIEPMNRNTGPAIGLAAIKLLNTDPEAVMFVLPSDHIIQPKESFIKSLSCAEKVVKANNYLVLFGIEPSRPETGYGYIEIADENHEQDGVSCYNVAQFKEKPSRVVAQEFYLDHKHLWNSGMFVWKAKDIMHAIERFLPDLYSTLENYKNYIGTPEEQAVLEKGYHDIEGISVDYGILEMASNVQVLWANFKWDDVGSWLSLDRVSKQDENDNTVIGNVELINSYDSTICNTTGNLIFADGISDLLVIQTEDALLLLSKSRIDDMREIIEILKGNENLKEYL
ncbi:NTP transferase domain-containing protein [bacterium]|nr:NTP transferase domain-containing protein [bacterium]